MPRAAHTAVIYIRHRYEQAYAKAHQVALDNDRSLSSIISEALEDWLVKHGHVERE